VTNRLKGQGRDPNIFKDFYFEIKTWLQWGTDKKLIGHVADGVTYPDTSKS